MADNDTTPTGKPEIDLVKDCNNVLTSLQDIRRPYEPQIDEILTFIYHSRRRIKEDKASRGKKTGQSVYDGTALGALNLLTDGLSGYTFSKSFKWFGYTLPHIVNFSRTSSLRSSNGKRLDEFPEVKNWLQETEEAMYSAFLTSNFYDVGPDFVRDAASVGTVTMTGDEDVGSGKIIFSVPHFRECFIAENYFGKVDTNYRVRNMTLKQLVEKFGWDQMVAADIPGKFQREYESNRNSEKEILHARYPREDYQPWRMDGKNKKFASVWIQRSPEKLLLESGTDQQSFVTWRWRKNVDEWFGRSPSWDAFVEVMTSQQQGRSNLTAGQKMAEPPMIGPPDLRGMVSRAPNGWTSLDDMQNRPAPLNEGIQIPFSLEMQNRTDQAIREHFQVEFFTMLTRAALNKVEITATQAIEMGGEKAVVLGPRIGRLETEGLGPIQDFVYSIEQKAGRLPEPPQILQDFGGADINIEYLGPLAQAQKKLFKTQGIEQGLGSLEKMASMFPEVLDNVDPDKTARDMLSSVGFPQKNLNDVDKVASIRQGRQAAAEEQQGFDQAITTAKAMPAAGKAIDPNSAAALLVGEDAQ